MKRLLCTAAFIALCPAIAGAVGLDRSGQNIDVLFEDGNYVQLSFGRVYPSVDGEDLALTVAPGVTLPGGQDSGNATQDFSTVALSLKYQFTDKLSGALILDEPYGSDVDYPVDGSARLGGTSAIVDSRAATALLRYKINDSFSVHGGLRYAEIEADVRLQGQGYGALSGYRGEFDADTDLGFLIGAAYERPAIALRVALTYSSKTTHDLETRESINGVGVDLITGGALSATSITEVETPQSLNLDFQTGIAPKTLLFGQIRYAWYEDTIVSPVFFDSAVEPMEDGSSLTDIEDNYGITLGVGRQLTDKFAASFSVMYDHNGEDDLVSPLAPTNGSRSVSLGGSYDITDALNLSTGVRYTWLNDARPETGTPDVARASFEDNNATSVGIQLGYRF